MEKKDQINSREKKISKPSASDQDTQQVRDNLLTDDEKADSVAENNEEKAINNAVEDGKSDIEPEADKVSIELQEMKAKYLRLYSEFENFRRRTAREKLDLIKTANEELIVALLPILDDFERADKSLQDATNEVPAALKEGFDLIQGKFAKTLMQKGLKAMEDVKGKALNTEFHEAITQMPAPEEHMKGKVVDVIEKGYLLEDKVIRYAKVVIGA